MSTLGTAVLTLFVPGVLLLVYLMLQATIAAPKPDVVVCVPAEMLEKIRDTMIHGLDDALRRHTIRVYNTWMKDPSEQPRRARAGMKHGIDAYIGAYKAAHDWNPPPCKQE